MAAEDASHRSAGEPPTRTAVAGATTIVSNASTPPSNAAAQPVATTPAPGHRKRQPADATSSASAIATFCGIRYVSDRPPATKVSTVHAANQPGLMLPERAARQMMPIT